MAMAAAVYSPWRGWSVTRRRTETLLVEQVVMVKMMSTMGEMVVEGSSEQRVRRKMRSDDSCVIDWEEEEAEPGL